MTRRLLFTKQIFHPVENQPKKTSYLWVFFLLTFVAGFISSYIVFKPKKQNGKDFESN